MFRFPSRSRRTGLAIRLMPWLLLLALAMRALVPSGYMPDRTETLGYWLELSLCHSTDPAPAATAPGDSLGDESAQSGADCPFGLLAAQPALIPSMAPLHMASWRSAPAQRAADTGALHAHGPRGPPLGSRAPPFPS